MKYARIIGLCVISVFVMAACVTSAAQGELSYFQCIKEKGGAYAEGECVTKAATSRAGKFEREAAVGTGYISVAKEAILFSTPGLELKGKPAPNMTCRLGARTTGEITAPSRDEEVITFQACEILEQGIKYCTSPGRPLGAIRTNALDSELVEAAPGRLGDRLSATGGASGVLAEFECAHVPLRIRGSMFGDRTSPLPEHAFVKSTLVFERELDLTTEVSDDGGATWLGPYPTELTMTTTNRGKYGAKIGVEL